MPLSNSTSIKNAGTGLSNPQTGLLASLKLPVKVVKPSNARILNVGGYDPLQVAKNPAQKALNNKLT